MNAKDHAEKMRPNLPYHLRNTVTIGTGCVTELRKIAADEIDRLREADQILRDLMQCDHWRHPRNDIYGRMVDYVNTSKERSE